MTTGIINLTSNKPHLENVNTSGNRDFINVYVFHNSQIFLEPNILNFLTKLKRFSSDLAVTCYAKSTNSTELLECANGNFAKLWNGCIHQGSKRVRCPKATFPCNSPPGNGEHFTCFENCSENGGRKECSSEGIT